MPKAYVMPGAKPAPEGHTYYKVFVPRAGYEHGRYVPMWGVKESPALGKITDGTENTLMFVEATEPVIWTKPEDIVVDAQLEDDGVPVAFRLGATDNGDELMACMGSCEVVTLRTSLPDARQYKRVLRRMIGYKDGEQEDWSLSFERRRPSGPLPLE